MQEICEKERIQSFSENILSPVQNLHEERSWRNGKPVDIFKRGLKG